MVSVLEKSYREGYSIGGPNKFTSWLLLIIAMESMTALHNPDS